MVETMSCSFRVDSISLMPRAGLRSVATRVVSRQTRSPTAEMRRGYIMATYTCSVPKVETDEMTSAAQVASAKEPNRSAPIPAMSPTLSPTLSAKKHNWV